MLHPSTQKLIDRLAIMTAQNKIDWIEKDNGDVLYATEGYIVRLTPEPPRVLLTTENGKALEDVTATQLNAAAHGEGGTYGELVATLARNACREARGTEAAINTLLKGLDETSEQSTEEASEAEAEQAESETPTTSEDSETEVHPESVSAGAPALEDQGDATTALSAEETADMADLADVSVPEAALLADEAETNVEDTPEASAEVPVYDAPETVAAEEDAASTSDTHATPAAEADDDDSFDVGGAVARLADEVNGLDQTEDAAATDADSADTEAAAEDTEDGAFAAAAPAEAETPAEGTGSASAVYVPFGADALTEQPTPAYSVAPEEAPLESPAEETDIADTIAPDAPQAGLDPAAMETEASPALETGASFEASAAETSEAPVTNEDAADSETGSTFAPAEADTRDAETGFSSESALASAPEAAEVETDEGFSAFSSEEAVTATSSESEPETASEAEATSETVTYMPFGAGGVQAAGTDISQEETPVEAELEAELPAAATMMTLGENTVADETGAPSDQPEETSTFETSTPSAFTYSETDSAEEPAPAETGFAAAPTDESTVGETAEETVSSEQEEASEPDTTSPSPLAAETPSNPSEAPGTISLSGLSAGLGFGATPTGFSPTPPKPSEAPQTQAGQTVEESVESRPVLIDATEDFPSSLSDAVTNDVPDVTNLPEQTSGEAADDFAETSVSQADLDAVAPKEDTQQPAETKLSLVQPEETEAAEEEEPEQPVRPKTRFNPWT